MGKLWKKKLLLASQAWGLLCSLSMDPHWNQNHQVHLAGCVSESDFDAVPTWLCSAINFNLCNCFFWCCLHRPQSGPRHRRAACGVVPHHSAGARPALTADWEWYSLRWETPTASCLDLKAADLWEEGSLYRILLRLQPLFFFMWL